MLLHPRLPVWLSATTLLCLAAHTAWAQPVAPGREAELDLVRRIAAEIERLALAVEPREAREQMLGQAVTTLALGAPDRLRALTPQMSEDARRLAEPMAAAAALIRDPANPVAACGDLMPDQVQGALVIAARYLAQADPPAARTLLAAQTRSDHETAVRAVLATALAESDPPAALECASGIQDQGTRERVFARIARLRGARDTTIVPAVIGRCYTHAARSAIWSEEAFTLRRDDPEGAGTAAEQALAEWRRIGTDEYVPPGLAATAARAVATCAPDRAGELAGCLADRNHGDGADLAWALAWLARVAPESARAIAQSQLETGAAFRNEWPRAHLLGIGLATGLEEAAREAKAVDDGHRSAVLATAALVDAPGAARFASEQGWLEQTWPLVNAASQLAPLDLPAALELIRALPMEPTQRAGYCWDLLRAAAEDDLEGALAELPTTMAWAGPESGVPGPMLRTLAQARLKRGYGLLPCMGLDLPLALPDVPLNAGARCSALSALAAAMREWYPEQAALAAAEAQRAALSLVQQEGNVWLASWVAPDLALASPEAVWRLMEAVPETSPEGQSSFRLAALLRIGETLTGELGWSGPYWEY